EARVFEAQLKAWNFSDVVKGASDQTNLVLENLTNQLTNVYMLIYPEGGGAPTFQGLAILPYRRATLSFADLGGIADGRCSVQMTTTGAIAAALTHYHFGGNGGALSDGSTGLGSNLGGRVEGYLAGAIVPTGGESHLNVFYSAGSPAFIVVDFFYTLS